MVGRHIHLIDGDHMFLLYTLLLMLGGIAMIVIGLAIQEQGIGSRILNVVVGLAFFGYGFYLMFLFDGGTYRIFFYAFILPILLIVRAFKARKEAKEEAAAHQFAGQGHPGQQVPQGHGYPAAPGQPAPGYPAAPGQPAQAWPAAPDQPGHAPQGQPIPQGQYGHPQGQPGYPTN